MNKETAFMQAICSDPDDDFPRLAYADFLEENGQAERSSFIRIQMQPCPVMYALRGDGKPSWLRCGSCERCKREWKLVFPPDKSEDWFTLPKGLLLKFASDQSNYSVPIAGVSRGFVSHLRVEADWFLRHADQLCWHPEYSRDVCPKCHGSGTYTVTCTNSGLSNANGYSSLTEYDEWRGCRSCSGDYDRKGTGYILRPMPATAQPITRVKLTTEPLIEGVVNESTSAKWRIVGREKAVSWEQYPHPDDATIPLLKAERPWIDFELP